jgi:hypothetical protein
MTKITKFLTAALLGLGSLFAAVPAYAESFDYDYDFETLTNSDANALAGTSAAYAGLGVFIWVLICFGTVVGLALLVWTIMMIVDVAKRKDYENQTLWLILLIAGLLLGFAIITTPLYYFMVKKKLGAPVVTPTPAS